MNDTALAARGIRKSFNGVEVLHGVDFSLRRGEIHGLVGQNGAGKSTLMKIINGTYSKDAGTIEINGHAVEITSGADAMRAGISMVYQEFSLIPTLTAAENIFLRREPKRMGLVDDKEMKRRAKELFSRLAIDIDPNVEISRLDVGKRQLVEIAKALSRDARILILDEPTASLSRAETDNLFDILRGLKQQGISIVFVSHHLDELMRVGDSVTVIRDGSVSMSRKLGGLSLDDVVEAMLGKRMEKAALRKTSSANNAGGTALEVRDLWDADKLRGVSFTLRQGEVLGLAGLLGAGKTEIFRALYGIATPTRGEILLHGKKISPRHPNAAIRLGMALVPEDRHHHGVLRGQSVMMNQLLPVWRRLRRWLFIDDRAGAKRSDQLISDLSIKTTGRGQPVERLSGGNQQKVVFAKAMVGKPKVFLLDDPSVGVDIHSKREIAQIVRNIASEGNSVIISSSELDELANICDRVLIIRKGKVTKELSDPDAITEASLALAVQEAESLTALTNQ